MNRWFLLLLALLAAPLAAVEISGLYETQVAVDSQAQQERERALSEALAKVLVKVAGRREVMGNPALRKALSRPSSYLKEYRYQTVRPPDDASGPARQVLWVQFDDGVVNRLLDGASVRMWGRARPSSLLWLAVEGGDARRRQMVGAGDPLLPRYLDAWAKDCGLPLLFPLMDATDQRSLSTSDVWGGFRGPLESASGRYEPDTIMSAAAREVDGRWRVDWLLLAKGGVQKWSTAGADLLAALHDGIDMSVDRLADLYLQAVGGFGEGPLEMAVLGIQDVAGYARVDRYLNDLDAIENARVLYAEADRVTFRIEAPHGRAAVEQAIGLGDTLVREPGELDWVFRLQP